MSRFSGEPKRQIDGAIDGVGRKRKTHCKQGHPYDEANTYWHQNWKGYQCRGCRACVRESVERGRKNPDVLKRGAAKAKRWREAHPEKYRIAWTKTQDTKKKILLDARIGGCIKCGEKDPSCLDFHHRNGLADKEGHIGEIRRFSIKRILAEIAKCDVLCANCHRKHHRDERSELLNKGES